MTASSIELLETQKRETGEAREARRRTVALPFRHQQAWVGGLYYVRNLIGGLGLLPPEARPRLIVAGDDPEDIEFLRWETGYADLEFANAASLGIFPEGRPLRAFLSSFAARLSGRAAKLRSEIDVVLLGSAPGLERRSIPWIPDFQEERFPEFFRPGEIHARRRIYGRSLARHRHVMVSSNDVRSDLQLYYGRNGSRIHVVPFASFADKELAGIAPAGVRSRHDLPPRFFICPNQIWLHKNHGVTLHALAAMKKSGAELPMIVFTGREHDYRRREYAPSVKALAAELGLTAKTRFLGFLPRGEQLALMSAAIAVIQPSLCEGWSGAVEDAKALGKHVIASDIAVHREQLAENADFFDPHDPGALADLLTRYREADPRVRTIDYPSHRQRFANDLLRMLREVAGEADGADP